MNHQNQIDLQQRDHFVQQWTTAVFFVPRAAVHDDAAVKRLLVVLYPRLHVVGEGVQTTLESTSQRRKGNTGPVVHARLETVKLTHGDGRNFWTF